MRANLLAVQNGTDEMGGTDPAHRGRGNDLRPVIAWRRGHDHPPETLVDRYHPLPIPVTNGTSHGLY